MTFYLAAAALPFVAALHRFSVSMGFRNWTVRQSWDDAVRVFAVVVLLSAFLSACQLAVT